MRIRWRGLELPSRVTRDEQVSTDQYGKFSAEPFERGFGTTVGNSLRRILLSSLEGNLGNLCARLNPRYCYQIDAGTVIAAPALGAMLAHFDSRPGAGALASCVVSQAAWGQDGLLKRLTGHTGEINGVAFSPSGERLVSASADRTALVWDLKGVAPEAPRQR